MRELLTDTETAELLAISMKKLYAVVAFFDRHGNDEWELAEGEHFEYASGSNRSTSSRLFYEEGVTAIAAYLKEKSGSNIFSFVKELFVEAVTKRKAKMRQLLVERRIIQETLNDNSVLIANDLIYLHRSKVINVLKTNGKGLNNSRKRQLGSDSYTGTEPLKKGTHFDEFDGVEHWSQKGIGRLAIDMAENSSVSKSRKAWLSAVSEVVEPCLEHRKKFLESFDAHVSKAQEAAKKLASGRCAITNRVQKPTTDFQLDGHHLFDLNTRKDLATRLENILVIERKIHLEFHSWHGKESCNPQDFLSFLTERQSHHFAGPHGTERLRKLMTRLEGLYVQYKDHMNYNL